MSIPAAKYNKLRTESPDQRSLAAILDRLGVIWMHCPNEGKRNKINGRLLKLAGMKTGFPDNIIFTPPRKYPQAKGAAIELKRAVGGDITEEQKEWIFKLRELGWLAVVANGIDEALNALKEWGYI